MMEQSAIVTLPLKLTCCFVPRFSQKLHRKSLAEIVLVQVSLGRIIICEPNM